jgi:hypothetical protein
LNDNPLPLFRSSGRPGYSREIGSHPHRVVARKRERQVQVRFAQKQCTVQTREGLVRANPGDAILTGAGGESWRVSQPRFSLKYRPIESTPPGEDGCYVSLPTTVFALQMDSDFQVLLSDGESKLAGRAGDWLLDYGDGSLGIVSKSAFSDSYEIVS